VGAAYGRIGDVRDDRERAYQDYVSARLPHLHKQAYLLTGDRHRADDLVQQTCVNLYVYWRRASAAGDLDGYVRRMLVNSFLNERRRAWFRRVRLGDVPELPSADPDPQDHHGLRRALKRVPPRQRAVLVLRFIYDLPVNEVADILGCSPGTVKSQAAHGLAAMRKYLGEPIGERG
jgi:RNA polymerase sigma-70 factor (sigma-E family)